METKNICEQLKFSLSNEKTNENKYIFLLKEEYGYQLTKSQLSIVLGVSTQTIDRRIKEGINLPNYTRSGEGIKCTYIFPVIEVAKYLCQTIKVK